MTDQDYNRVATVVAGISFPAIRRDMMQRFADAFFHDEPRFDYVTFALACGCRTVDVPASYVREGDEIMDGGRIGKVRSVNDTVTFRMKRQGSVQFQADEKITLICEV
jgi:hypothetical protein